MILHTSLTVVRDIRTLPEIYKEFLKSASAMPMVNRTAERPCAIVVMYAPTSLASC